MKILKSFITLLLILASFASGANNIVISNITSVTGSGYVQLQFDLSWDNSWYSSINNDAAWVFFKFKDNDGTWRHLSLTNANNSIASGYTISVPSDNTGAMIARNTTGSGTVTLTSVRVGVTNLPGSFDVRGFAIEMVKLPYTDTYYMGDGQGSGSSWQSGSTGNSPFLVNSTTIVTGTTAGQLYTSGVTSGTLAASFPIGYNGAGGSLNLYMMKHEISQGAYRDFLNALTYDQQFTRTGIAPSSPTGTIAITGAAPSRRNGLEIATSGVSNTTPAVYGCDLSANNVYNEASDGEWIAANYLTYPDVAAFLDWAALRPMTELEYEKSCRGTLTPVNGEYASGTTAVASSTYSISNSGQAGETVTYTGSIYNTNVTYQLTSPGGNSPLRVGIHATPYATRISAGAGYYGALDLSGNVEEFCVTAISVAGRSFTGVSGDGTLTTTGDADEDFWPGIGGNNTTTVANTAYSGTGVTGIAGIVGRGGSAGTVALAQRVSNIGAQYTVVSHSVGGGGRGVKAF